MWTYSSYPSSISSSTNSSEARPRLLLYVAAFLAGILACAIVSALGDTRPPPGDGVECIPGAAAAVNCTALVTHTRVVRVRGTARGVHRPMARPARMGRRAANATRAMCIIVSARWTMAITQEKAAHTSTLLRRRLVPSPNPMFSPSSAPTSHTSPRSGPFDGRPRARGAPRSRARCAP